MSRILIITEKPSVARTIANFLGNAIKEKNYYKSGNYDVAHCRGHILELFEPEDYDSKYKDRNDVSLLPIIPNEFKLKPSVPDLLKTIKTLSKNASTIYHVGDAGTAGQLLVDEVIQYIGYKGNVLRMILVDYERESIQTAFDTLKPNTEPRYVNNYYAGLARQHADWLVGMNLSRLYTSLAKNSGFPTFLAVGRVLTALVGVIVRHDRKIDSFVPTPFYKLKAPITSSKGSCITQWQPIEQLEKFLDDKNRLINKQVADKLAERLSDQAGKVVKCEKKKSKKSPPAVYDIGDLQKDASRYFGYSPIKTLEYMQSLYDSGYLSYPRTDSKKIPNTQYEKRKEILKSIYTNAPQIHQHIKKIDINKKTKVWVDWNVDKHGEHYGVIPTTKAGNAHRFSEDERNIYELVCLRFLAQFLPDYEYYQSVLIVNIQNHLFKATGTQIISNGWKDIYINKDTTEDGKNKENNEEAVLPMLNEGDQITSMKLAVIKEMTKKPSRFKYEDLISLMSGISKYVSDADLKKVLNEASGIGTPATKAGIIDKVFQLGFAEVIGKNTVESTEIGKVSITHILPKEVTLPDMSALWEMSLTKIKDGTMTYEQFIAGIEGFIKKLVNEAKEKGSISIPGYKSYRCSVCSSPLGLIPNKHIFYCSNKDCSTYYDEVNGKPVPQIKDEYPCNEVGCEGKLRRVRGKDGHFWSCSSWKEGCKGAMDDVNGKPGKSAKPKKRNQARRTKGPRKRATA